MHKLEKLNSSIDIIPLQNMDGGSMRRMAGGSSSSGGHLQGPPPANIIGGAGKSSSGIIDKRQDDSGRILRDPMIISRVRTYLYENEDKVYIDVTEMADHLQRKYRDYRGKKRGPFRAMVRRAYDEITENLTRQADTHWQEDDDEIDIEVDAMPAEYMQSYKRQMGRQNGNSSDKELIDISSDDEQGKSGPTGTSTYRADKESMEVEPVQAAKRPHLSPSIEANRHNNQQFQPQETPMEIQPSKSSRPEKSRKRPREKDDDEAAFEIQTRKKPKDLPVVKPTVKFSDMGGINKVLETVANLLVHMKHPEVYTKLGIAPPRGFLLHGPPGCGKTLLAHAVAGELNIPLLKVAGPELVAGVSGESEQRIRDLFEQAHAIAPCILFLDEIDAIAPHRATAQKEMERRIVSQLLSCVDELSLKDNGNKVLVLGATNRPDSLDPALRRAGRFDREVSLGIPDKEARAAILGIHTAKVSLSPEISLAKIASLTPGFVGADLVALIREAAMAAVNRTFDDLKKKVIPVETAAPPSEPQPIDDSIVEIKEKPAPEPEITDVIIEEDPTAKTDAVENSEKQTNDKEPAVTNGTEEQKSPEESTPETEKPTEESTEAKTEKSETTETPKSPEAAEAAVATTTSSQPETTETPKSPKSPEISAAAITSSQPETAVAETTVTNDSPAKESESAQSMQGVEENSNSGDSGGGSGGDADVGSGVARTLEDILNWLHNEPPLSPEQLALLCVEESDFDVALKTVQPSAKREGFATVPDVTWDDIGSLQDIRQELQMTILAPIRHSAHFASLGLTTPTGVLLCGPPGCGKTLLAKAIANEAGINFISVKGPELLNMYVGESEKAVRQCFIRARNSAPCVIFFDELDALCPKRSEGDSTATSRVVNQMLTEMDGVEGRKEVFLMAASNRPDIIDPAVLRPGRLDKILYVGLPNPTDRIDILQALTKNGTMPKLAADVSLEIVGSDERCNGFTGADLAALVREAGVETLREIMGGMSGPAEICARHFEAAFDKIRPSVQDKDIKHYEKLQKLYSVRKIHTTDVPMKTDSPIDSVMEAMET